MSWKLFFLKQVHRVLTHVVLESYPVRAGTTLVAPAIQYLQHAIDGKCSLQLLQQRFDYTERHEDECNGMIYSTYIIAESSAIIYDLHFHHLNSTHFSHIHLTE